MTENLFFPEGTSQLDALGLTEEHVAYSADDYTVEDESDIEWEKL